MEYKYYLLENNNNYFISYKQIRNFIKNNKLKDEMVFKNFYIEEETNFILLATKDDMKKLEELCKKFNRPIQRIIENTLKNNLEEEKEKIPTYYGSKLQKDRDMAKPKLRTSLKIDEEDETFTINANEEDFIFRVVFKK